MIVWLSNQLETLNIAPSMSTVFSIIIILLGAIIVSWAANFIAKRIIVRALAHVLSKRSKWGAAAIKNQVFTKLSHIAPAIVIYLVAPIVEIEGMHATSVLAKVIESGTVIYMIAVIAWVLMSCLNTLETIYSERKGSKRKPIKSYTQVIKLLITMVTVLLVISVLFEKSPLTLLTGIGAIAAILMLVFKDSILGLVASIQISFYDMLHLGDWVVLPSYGADGDVIEISLNTIKVQNFDKTIVTIPTSALLTSGVRNWRGMQEAGGRRIKRAINIDMNTIKFCNNDMIARFKKMNLLKGHIEKKENEISEFNQIHTLAADLKADGRHLTNIGVFRAYVEAYVRRHPKVHQEYTLLIRQLQPTELGLPLELYIFTNDTNWINYEGIQADIFDHLLAILPEFELSAFQNSSGQMYDVRLHHAN